MSDVISVLSSLFTWVMSSLSSLVTAITSNELLLLFVVLGLCGLAVGFFHRITRA